MSPVAGAGEYLRRVEHGRVLLKQIRNAFPCPALEEAYFDNLYAMLDARPRRNGPGQLVLGVGSGRCGSTTLTKLFATAPNSCATHENPPLIGWEPTLGEVEFHIRRFDALRLYFDVVFDAAHWWLNLAQDLREIYPDLKVVGLVRDTESCVASFRKVQVSPTRHVANWREIGVPPEQDSPWSRTYPSYPVSVETACGTTELQTSLIRRYVHDYNHRVGQLREAAPEWVTAVRTEELKSAEAQGGILRFADCAGEVVSQLFNTGGTVDGASDDLIY